MKKIVESNEIPGILAYYDGKEIGWGAVAPRSAFSVLSRSRILKPIDYRPCWSIDCLFDAKKFRKIGVLVELIKAASDYAKKSGDDMIEGSRLLKSYTTISLYNPGLGSNTKPPLKVFCILSLT